MRWNRRTDLWFSPDDEGWYFQHRITDKTSQVFPSRSKAVAAYRSGDIIWS